MPFLTYPPSEEVVVLIKSVQLWPESGALQKLARRQAFVATQSAAQEWETLTGWLPFLSSGAVETRYFDSDDIENGLLRFGAGLLSLTSLKVGDTFQELGDSYRLSPRNAAAQKQPFTALELGGYGWGYGCGSASEIAVTGVWGYSLTIPADAYQAINQQAAAIVLKQIYNPQSLGSISMEAFNKQLDITGSLTPQDLAKQWGQSFTILASRYKRVIV